MGRRCSMCSRGPGLGDEDTTRCISTGFRNLDVDGGLQSGVGGIDTGEACFATALLYLSAVEKVSGPFRNSCTSGCVYSYGPDDGPMRDALFAGHRVNFGWSKDAVRQFEARADRASVASHYMLRRCMTPGRRESLRT